ncbi:MAG: hypothetical protein V1754_14480, partial [Pseudomonadota bacterium]
DIPDLFGQKPVFVAGRYNRGGAGTVTIYGRLAGRNFRQSVRITLPEEPSNKNRAVAHLWARRQIADLMDIYSTEPNRTEEIEKSVTQIALSYNLMSKFTSFVAVDEMIRNQGGMQQTVSVPVPLPQGVDMTAAPANAYVGGIGTMQSKTADESLRAVGPVLPNIATSGGYGKNATRYYRLQEKLKVSRENEKDERKTPSSKLTISLRSDYKVLGNSNSSDLGKKLRMLTSRLAEKVRSVSPGTKGQLKIRLTLNQKGEVIHVSFVSGNLMFPTLMKELSQYMRAWQFETLSSQTNLVFNVVFS